MRRDVAFATMTLARDTAEERLLSRALGRLAAFGQPVIVADGGSPAPFVDAVAALPPCRVLRSAYGPGLVGQIRTALGAALDLDVPVICYTEPDKVEFFNDGLECFLADVDAGGRFGVALASRTADAFATFPPMQQYAERAINDLMSDATGVVGDYSYGPFAMSRAVARRVVALEEDIGWGWRHFAFLAALRLGFTLQLSPGAYECPPAQRHEDPAERLHRVNQLEQNSRGLLLGQRAPLADE